MTLRSRSGGVRLEVFDALWEAFAEEMKGRGLADSADNVQATLDEVKEALSASVIEKKR